MSAVFGCKMIIANVHRTYLSVKCKGTWGGGSAGTGISLHQYALVPSHVAIMLLFVFSLLNVVQAATQITGTVLDADTKLPLKNAMVSLKSTGDLTLTNESGTFSLTKSEVNTVKTNQVAPATPFTIQRNNLQLTISTQNTSVQLVVLNLKGQIIYKTIRTLQPGLHDVDLTKSLSTNSTYIVQIKINQKNYITKILPLAVRPTGCPAVLSSISSPAVRPSRFLAVSSPDTLIVSKYLYISAITPLAVTNTISLQKPDSPPPPPGMKAIPGGSYMRGSTHTFSDNDEQPVKEITISPFFMDSTEVTQADFKILLNAQPWADVVFPGSGNNYPVWRIAWYDAAYYCNVRSKRDGIDTAYTFDSINGRPGYGCIIYNLKTDFTKKGYRLPTESEWEYAARGGASTEYYWGIYSKIDLITPTKYAWYDTNAAHPVAMKLPNNFGLYDIAGNVYECVNDYYNSNSYYSEEIIDPKGPTGGDERIVRGGAWVSRIDDIRPAERNAYKPDMVFTYIGLRVILPNK